MYHSYLVIDTGSNPDKPRPGRRWLGNIYHVHQRLCMGFPTEVQKVNDYDFLKPFMPEGFLKNCLGSNGSVNSRPKFLFRIEHNVKENENIAVICVQSEQKPDWEYAFKNAMILLKHPPVYLGEIYFDYRLDEVLNFRLFANLSVKSDKYNAKGEKRLKSNVSVYANQIDGEEKTMIPSFEESNDNHKREQGKRVSFYWSNKENRDKEIKEKWFDKKANYNNWGFETLEFKVVNVGWRYGWKNDGNKAMFRYRTALLEGMLKVTDETAFLNTLRTGIGPAKAFGFGLLSVSRSE